MKTRNAILAGVSILAIALAVLGCGGSTPPPAPLSQFQPQIANNPDNFQFQATAVQNVTAIVQYIWSNSGTQASINHSSAVDSGTTVVQLFDANNVEVYSSALLASGTPATSAGTAGNWKIKVTLTNVYGTLNFRAQMM
ncbi:MAG: hypothetical protein HY851_02145 [candidate division Zixibacteria bacterium]|nr:hypothetical protein [candidate division Zixibacteria bacterium]